MPSFHISLYLIDNIQYINSYRRSGRVIRDIKLRCHAIIAQIFTTHTSSRYRALTFLSFPPLSFSLSLPIYPVNCLGEWLLSIAAQIKDKYHVECALYSHFACVWLNTWLLSVLCYRYRLLATWGDKGICTRSLAWLVERFLLLAVSFLKFWYRTKELLPLWFTPSINWSFT